MLQRSQHNLKGG